MKVFISWSGARSHAAAAKLRDWLQDVLQYSEPFVSSEDIAKGRRWLPEIMSELKEAGFGIICLTRENMNAPWVLFEAGALGARYTEGRVSCLLVGMSNADVEPPLGQFQNTANEKAEVFKLVASVNSNAESQALPEERLRRAFETHWPKLEQGLREIEQDKRYEGQGKPKRDSASIAEETLETVRSLHRLLTDEERERKRKAVAEALLRSSTPMDLGEIITGLRSSPSFGGASLLGGPGLLGGHGALGEAEKAAISPRGALDPAPGKGEKKS
jgi:hypothetical protein